MSLEEVISLDVSSFVNGFSDAITSFKQMQESLKNFFSSVSNVFVYLPSQFWVIILGALVVVVLLRVVGR